MIYLFSLMEWEFCVSTQHPHNTGFKELSPDFSGTRIFALDSKGTAFICNPMDCSMLTVPNLPSNINKVLWDHSPSYKGIFIAFDEEVANSFIYISDSLEGSKVDHLHTFPRNDLYPALLVDEEITFITPTGKTSAMPVPGHQLDMYGYVHDPVQLENNFQIALKLRRFDQAFYSGLCYEVRQHWRDELANAACAT
ncbi:hypothetical protein JTE90_019128 [Oedothorax gibbosus]|uniref:WDR19 WD40 repeat domain-containing protein n=1 Tax=Oedothorax gibbosus TaxID=931172 RepID=A0AAV6TFW2_9ARAC|nr:hypothetical protein JTE90_019128 [Oedothorax gibbosus]